MKIGHRGTNQPVKNLSVNKVEITTQNHGYTVDAESLENTDFEITHTAINDDTVEGIRHKTEPVFSVQYHPEAGAGPHESSYSYDQFIDLMLTEAEVQMPKRKDINTILVIGSGPTVIVH